MTHIVLGYPSLETSRQLVDCMVAAGVDAIEVQIPFSDPTADGPVITRACQTALDGGVRVADALRFLAEVTARHATPFLVMSYFNIAFAYRDSVSGGHGGADGVRGFAAAVARAGACGLILPDVPPEMSRERYPEACAENGIHPVYVVSPNIGPDRLRAVGKVGSGLLYATSRTGTTGREMDLEMERLTRFLAQARQICRLPIAVGFSISRREQVEALAGHAEIAVVGTHLICAYEGRGVAGVEAELARLQGR
jgi:tryptophan synthase alpha chain